MEITDLLREIDAMISRLVQARGLLSNLEDSNVIRRKRGRPRVYTSIGKATKATATHQLSFEERAKVAASLKARWAKLVKGPTTTQNAVVSRARKKTPTTKATSKKKA